MQLKYSKYEIEKKYYDAFLNFIRFWHGDHNDEYMIEEMGYEESEDDENHSSCDVYNAIVKYEMEQIDIEELFNTFDEVDSEWQDSWDNHLEMYRRMNDRN